jgi:hypothetical protein
VIASRLWGDDVVIRLARQIADALREHPFALAMVVVDVLVMALVAWMLYLVSATVTKRDVLIEKLVTQCAITSREDR